jgi:hypothetical protein
MRRSLNELHAGLMNECKCRWAALQISNGSCPWVHNTQANGFLIDLPH